MSISHLAEPSRSCELNIVLLLYALTNARTDAYARNPELCRRTSARTTSYGELPIIKVSWAINYSLRLPAGVRKIFLQYVLGLAKPYWPLMPTLETIDHSDTQYVKKGFFFCSHLPLSTVSTYAGENEQEIKRAAVLASVRSPHEKAHSQ